MRHIWEPRTSSTNHPIINGNIISVIVAKMILINMIINFHLWGFANFRTKFIFSFIAFPSQNYIIFLRHICHNQKTTGTHWFHNILRTFLFIVELLWYQHIQVAVFTSSSTSFSVLQTKHCLCQGHSLVHLCITPCTMLHPPPLSDIFARTEISPIYIDIAQVCLLQYR